VDSGISLKFGLHMNVIIIKPESGDSISGFGHFSDGYDNSNNSANINVRQLRTAYYIHGPELIKINFCRFISCHDGLYSLL